MSISINTIKAITSDMRDLKDELKEVKNSMKSNTKELSKINNAIAKEGEAKLAEVARARQTEQFESSRYPLVESNDSALGPVDVDLTLKKLNIL